MEIKNRVIYIWSTPAVGHLNPTLCFTNQLLSRLHEMNIDKIIFYSGTAFRDLILDLPNNAGKNLIEFRDYELKKYWGHEDLLKILMDWDTRPGKIFRVFRYFENSLKLGSKHLFDRLGEDMHREKPVFVLHDNALFFGKLALSLYEEKYKCPKPLSCCYLTTFLWVKDIFPLWSDISETGLLAGRNCGMMKKLKTLVLSANDLFRYLFLFVKTIWWDYGVTLYDILTKIDLPLTKLQLMDDLFNIVFILPDIQPRIERLQWKNVNFVGPGVDESLRLYISSKINNMEKYVNTIDSFLAKNLSDQGALLAKNNQLPSFVDTSVSCEYKKNLYKPIIYVCMGTVFNTENADLFQVIVEACNYFSSTNAIIVSTGNEKVYLRYANSPLNNNSTLFIPHTPQIEILKIAHVFISHAGINSVSEAINYGVPFICIPLYGDQPLVAHKVADELDISIRLDPDSNLTVERVKDSIQKIISNPKYKKSARELAKKSQEYPGSKTASDLIVKYVKENERVVKREKVDFDGVFSKNIVKSSFILFYFGLQVYFFLNLLTCLQ